MTSYLKQFLTMTEYENSTYVSYYDDSESKCDLQALKQVYKLAAEAHQKWMDSKDSNDSNDSNDLRSLKDIFDDFYKKFAENNLIVEAGIATQLEYEFFGIREASFFREAFGFPEEGEIIPPSSFPFEVAEPGLKVVRHGLIMMELAEV